MSDQILLDESQADLQTVLKLTAKLGRIAAKKAGEYCNNGNNALGADLHDIAAMLNQSEAAARAAYAAGRRLEGDTGGGVISPRSGGS